MLLLTLNSQDVCRKKTPNFAVFIKFALNFKLILNKCYVNMKNNQGTVHIG